ncbi:MAG: DUF58 domain-containing protein, partial [Bifidobacteriaceae bacterium]|nr:DUF58 domain-containing protein [Bifidobacteriaceae bacterium]
MPNRTAAGSAVRPVNPPAKWFTQIGKAGAAAKPRQAVRPLGWLTLSLGIVLGGAGWFGGWRELAAGGGGLLAVWLVAWPMSAGALRFTVSLDMANCRTQVGRAALGDIQVINPTPHRCLPATLRLTVGGEVRYLAVPALRPGQTHQRLVEVSGQRRGVVRVGPLVSYRGDPLGLVERAQTWCEPLEVYIHPLTVALQGTVPGTFRDLEGLTTRDLSDRDIAFHALREYRLADDARNIHWLASACGRGLLVKQYEDTRRVHTALLLDTDPTAYRSDADFELAVAAMASVARQAFKEGRSIQVLAGAKPISCGSLGALLD